MVEIATMVGEGEEEGKDARPVGRDMVEIIDQPLIFSLSSP